MRYVCKWLAIDICAVLALLTLLLVAPGLFGIHPLIVQSRSMEPVYPAGSLLYVRDTSTDGSDLAEGEPVTFFLPDLETLVTHRIVSVDRKQQVIHTKGDANELADEIATPFSSVTGLPLFCIPYLGYVAECLSGTFGKFCIFLMVILVFFLSWLDGAMHHAQNKVQKIDIIPKK